MGASDVASTAINERAWLTVPQPFKVVLEGRLGQRITGKEVSPEMLRAVVVESFAGISYRDAINNELPVIVCPGVASEAKEGGFITVNVETGEIKVGGKILRGRGISGMALEILEAGGLLEHLEELQQGS